MDPRRNGIQRISADDTQTLDAPPRPPLVSVPDLEQRRNPCHAGLRQGGRSARAQHVTHRGCQAGGQDEEGGVEGTKGLAEIGEFTVMRDCSFAIGGICLQLRVESADLSALAIDAYVRSPFASAAVPRDAFVIGCAALPFLGISHVF
jgi:hypothetical protein